MATKDKGLKDTIKSGVKALIVQEIRRLRLERTFAPPILIDEIAQSILETKKEIVKLGRAIAEKERAALLKRLIRQAVDEEINHAIEMRNVKCLRCLHGRFYDEEETAHVHLPIGPHQAQSFGCDQLESRFRETCKRFVEKSRAASLEDYLNEMAFLYEFRDWVDELEEIWKEYFTKR